eukprot:755816-Prymnesium_polylepis.2
MHISPSALHQHASACGERLGRRPARLRARAGRGASCRLACGSRGSTSLAAVSATARLPSLRIRGPRPIATAARPRVESSAPSSCACRSSRPPRARRCQCTRCSAPSSPCRGTSRAPRSSCPPAAGRKPAPSSAAPSRRRRRCQPPRAAPAPAALSPAARRR